MLRLQNGQRSRRRLLGVYRYARIAWYVPNSDFCPHHHINITKAQTIITIGASPTTTDWPNIVAHRWARPPTALVAKRLPRACTKGAYQKRLPKRAPIHCSNLFDCRHSLDGRRNLGTHQCRWSLEMILGCENVPKSDNSLLETAA